MFGEPVWFARRGIEQRRSTGAYVMRWLLFAVALMIAATGFAALLGLIGEWLLGNVDPRAKVAAGGLMAVTVLVRETLAQQLPVPEIRWQVPREWMQFYLRAPLIFGGVMGLGVLTRQPSMLFHLYVAACVLATDVGVSAGLGAVYGATYVIVFARRTFVWRHEAGGGEHMPRAVAWSERVRIAGAVAGLTIVAVPAL